MNYRKISNSFSDNTFFTRFLTRRIRKSKKNPNTNFHSVNGVDKICWHLYFETLGIPLGGFLGLGTRLDVVFSPFSIDQIFNLVMLKNSYNVPIQILQKFFFIHFFLGPPFGVWGRFCGKNGICTLPFKLQNLRS